MTQYPPAFRALYDLLEPAMPRPLQIFLRRQAAALMRRRGFPEADSAPPPPPLQWNGWPDGRRFAFVILHDIQTRRGFDRCIKLMQMDREEGFVSSFNFIPERPYEVNPFLFRFLRANGFEIGLHDPSADSGFFRSGQRLEAGIEQINRYLLEWGAEGFRADDQSRNREWLHALSITYDASTPETDPFGMPPAGLPHLFPFEVASGDRRYIELPSTLPQDFTLFVIMKETSSAIWKKKLEWIARHGGMALVITHPDYMNFGETRQAGDEYPAAWYADFLKHVRTTYKNEYWNTLPKNVAHFFHRLSAPKEDAA